MEFAKPEDVEALAPRLRGGDIEELRCYNGDDGMQALRASLANAKICLTLKGRAGHVAAMFGVGWTANPRIGRVWLLSSDYLYEVGRPFLRECPEYIALFMRGHDVIYNHVHDRNLPSVKWLEWLGFEITQRFPEVGDAKAPFSEYCKFRDVETKRLYLNRDWSPFLPDGYKATL